MNIKTKIKNDLWRINYIVHFVKKHQFDEKGQVNVAKHVLRAYKNIRPIRGKGHRSVGKDTKAILSAVEVSVSPNSHFVYFIDTGKTLAVPGNIISNFTLDYRKIIQGSFMQLASEAIGDDAYGKEAQLVIEGITNLVDRTVKAVRESGLSEQIKQKRINDFTHLLDKPAEHFDEALQRILFFNQILWQTRHRLNGLGRLDIWLDDVYQKDILTGYLTKDDAEKYIVDFLTQLNRYADYKSDALEGDIGQIIILGGLDAQGKYFCNDLTYMFLEIQASLKRPDPKVFLRVSREMPDALLKLGVKCLQKQTGSPLFANDDVIVPALLDFGMPKEDAYSYCASACWEPYIVGKSLDQNNIAVFDYFDALDKVMGGAFDTFEEFLEAYQTQNVKNFKAKLDSINELKWAKDPLVSMFTEGCNEQRADITAGVSPYKNYGITTVAISNTVDSLLNIKSIVYDDKICSLQELNEKRLCDYANDPVLFARIQNNGGHFGHDDPEAIAMTESLTRPLAEIAKAFRNPLGGTVKFGLSSPGYNILSKKMPADVSGRKAGAPYNTHISCMDASYTEVVNFASQLSYKDHRFNGNVIDFFLPTGFLAENIDKFVLFMRAAIQIGFFQMQLNVMDSKTLIDAKAHPEQYPGLIVRVWGFSAYFNELPESYKDLLIERALAAEKMM